MSGQTVRVRVAEPLRFFLPPRYRQSALTTTTSDGTTVGHLAESLGIPRTEIGDLRINSRAVTAKARPDDGDQAEIFQVLRPQPIAQARFVLDVHLGTLATDFAQCRSCARPHWHGAHARRLDEIIATAHRR